MNLEFIGFTLGVIGEILIAYTVILVHRRVWKEHRMSARVFTAMKTEQGIAVVGVILIIVGYFLQLPTKI